LNPGSLFFTSNTNGLAWPSAVVDIFTYKRQKVGAWSFRQLAFSSTSTKFISMNGYVKWSTL